MMTSVPSPDQQNGSLPPCQYFRRRRVCVGHVWGVRQYVEIEEPVFFYKHGSEEQGSDSKPQHEQETQYKSKAEQQGAAKPQSEDNDDQGVIGDPRQQHKENDDHGEVVDYQYETGENESQGAIEDLEHPTVWELTLNAVTTDVMEQCFKQIEKQEKKNEEMEYTKEERSKLNWKGCKAITNDQQIAAAMETMELWTQAEKPEVRLAI